MPRILAEAFDLAAAGIVAIPIVEPEISHTIGLVTQARDLEPPLIRALIAEARRLAPGLVEMG